MNRRKIEQRERREIKGGTYSAFAASEADAVGGRFAAEAKARVIGSTPTPASQYPAASAHQIDPCGLEPPFPLDIGEPVITGEAFEVERSLSLSGGSGGDDPPSEPSPNSLNDGSLAPVGGKLSADALRRSRRRISKHKS